METDRDQISLGIYFLLALPTLKALCRPIKAFCLLIMDMICLKLQMDIECRNSETRYRTLPGLPERTEL